MERTGRGLPARAGTTRAAGVLALLVPLPFVVLGLSNVVTLLGGRAEEVGARQGLAALGVSIDASAAFLQLGALLLLGLSAWSAVLGLGILARRSWARDAALFTFAVFALSIPLSLAGLTAEPPAPNAWVGLLTGVMDVAVLVLLLQPATSDDFGLTNRARSRRDQLARRSSLK